MADRTETLHDGGTTMVVPVIGDPTVSAVSPGIWNDHFVREQINAVCVPIQLPSAGLAPFLEWIRVARNVPGFLSSSPHKADLVNYCDSLEDSAIGAVNTVRSDRDGSLHGAIFDGQAAMEAVRRAGAKVTGASVAICGAGAAGRSIAFAAARAGAASLTVTDIDKRRAMLLVLELRGAGYGGIDYDDSPKADILVNASPAGWNQGECAFGDGAIRCAVCIVETLSAPWGTKLVSSAKAAGTKVATATDVATAQLTFVLDFLGLKPRRR